MDSGEAELYALRWPAGPEAAEALRRLWEEGRAVLPLRPDLPAPETERLLELASPSALVEPAGVTLLEGATPVAREVALCLPTAGSSGPPKLVELSRRALQVSARLTAARLGSGGARWLCCLPLDHVAGIMTLVRSWAGGPEPVVLPGFDVDEVADADADAVSLVPTMLERLLARGIDVGSWSWILLGGAAAPPDLLERAAAAGGRVVRTYGMTETSGGVVYDGVPLDGVEVDVSGEGRIRLRTPTVMERYRGDPAATAAALTGGWLHTGDVGEWSGGRLRVLGRSDEVIVTGGEKVSPHEVEALLATHPRVADVAVAARPDSRWGQRVVAYVVAAPGAPPTLADLRAHVKDRAAAYKAPADLVLVPSLPRLPSGKVARAALGTHS